MSTLKEQFQSMTEAQKTYVLGALANKILQNPKEYGMHEDGILRVGDTLDLTAIFGDTEEIKSIFNKAQTVSGQQEKTVVSNYEKISNWIKNHPDAELTEDKVSEILNSEIKPESQMQKPDLPQKGVAEPKPEPGPAQAPEPARFAFSGMRASPQIPEPDKKTVEEQTKQEIMEAKQRLSVLEEGKKMRSMNGDISMVQEVDKAFLNEINGIYGKSGLLGMGKEDGVNTAEWKEMSRFPAMKVVDYFTGDSVKSGLPEEISERINKSKKHTAFIKQILELIRVSQGAVKPFENENIELYFKRLGGYVLRTHLQGKLEQN